jgi:hypothetical protein
MPRAMLLLSLLLAISPAAQSQIVIRMNEVPSLPGTEFRYYAQTGDSFLVNVGNPGGPQVWDFTQGDTSATATDLYLDPAVSPPQYDRANVVIQTSQLNLFGLSEPGILYCGLVPRGFYLGAATTLYQGATLALNFNPYLNQYPLPLRLGAAWNNTVNVDQVYTVSGSEYRLVLTSTLNHTVDAWGTVLAPLGNYPALRVRTNVTFNMTLYIRLLFVWIPIAQQSGASVNYDWRAENVGTVLNVTTTHPDPGMVWATKLSRLMDSTVMTVASLPQTRAGLAPPDLMVNYPNPFNARTIISFSLAKPEEVRLSIYDLMGREVAILAEGLQEAGEHEVAWEPFHLSSGLYVAALRVGGRTSHHPIIYLK